MYDILHQGHIRIERTEMRARNTVHWPGISKDVTELISSYKTYISFPNTQSTKPLLKHEFLINHALKLGLLYFRLITKIT